MVLDHSQKPDWTTLHITFPKELLDQFLQYFQQLCGRVCKAEEPILLWVFCHGDLDTYGLQIGGKKEDGSLRSVEEISNILAVNESLDISIMMTPCFPGGWIVTPLLRSERQASKATVFTAAGQSTVSESCVGSQSYCACRSGNPTALGSRLSDICHCRGVWPLLSRCRPIIIPTAAPRF